MVICLERGADLHMAQLMSLPLTVSCFSNIQIGVTFLVPAHPGSPGKGPLNGCVCDSLHVTRTVGAQSVPNTYIPVRIPVQFSSCLVTPLSAVSLSGRRAATMLGLLAVDPCRR